MKRHIKRFNESDENLNISDVRSSEKIKENFDYKKILIDILIDIDNCWVYM